MPKTGFYAYPGEPRAIGQWIDEGLKAIAREELEIIPSVNAAYAEATKNVDVIGARCRIAPQRRAPHAMRKGRCSRATPSTPPRRVLP
jgi:hypothetical protein